MRDVNLLSIKAIILLTISSAIIYIISVKLTGPRVGNYITYTAVAIFVIIGLILKNTPLKPLSH
jgi:hypothetical protein